MKPKRSIICKGIESYDVDASILKTHKPKAGDIALFRVLNIGKHSSIQSENGNNSYIYPGDIIMMAFGSRYATGQFEGYVPDEFLEEYQILGKGGAIGKLASMNYRLLKVGPTNCEIIGYAIDENGAVINTKDLNKKKHPVKRFSAKRKGKLILSLGSSMDSGKTTTAAYLSRGLSLAGKDVAYIKLTGTVYARDRSYVRDTGARYSIDFSTLGYPSTFLCSHTELLALFKRLMTMAEDQNPDYIIMEIADGLLQRETAMLINSPQFMKYVSGVFFSAGDSMSAMHGIYMLEKLGIKILALSGLFTASPLLEREVRENTAYPVLNLNGLEDPNVHDIITQQLENARNFKKEPVNHILN